MSIESWCKEFYETSASEVSEADALEHSIRKWRGLLPSNLAKHGLRRGSSVSGRTHEIEGRRSADDESTGTMAIWSLTCALCWCHASPDGCYGCELYDVRGGVRCDVIAHGVGETKSPYLAFTEDGDAKPMLRWLRAARAEVRAKAKEARKVRP